MTEIASQIVVRGAFALAAVSACMLRRRLPTHRATALALVATFALDLLRPALLVADAPLVLRRAAFLAFPALSLWCTGETFALMHGRLVRISRVVPAVLWAACVFAVGLVAPPARSPASERMMLGIALVALLIEGGILSTLLARRRIPTISETVVTLLVVGDAVTFAGPWLHGGGQAWILARYQWAIVYCFVAGLQGWRIAWDRSIALEHGSSRWARRSPSPRSCSSGEAGRSMPR